MHVVCTVNFPAPTFLNLSIKGGLLDADVYGNSVSATLE